MDSPESITKTYSHPENISKYSSTYLIGELVGENKAVLDVGCAQGDLARYLQRYNSKVWGVDGNAEAVQEAAKYCIETKVVDLNTQPTQKIFDRNFDDIVFADVLEHLLYPEKVLAYFKDYLEPDGRLIITLPNIGIWRSRLNLLFGRFEYTDYGVMDRTHLHLYTFKTAAELITSNGLTIEKIHGVPNVFGPIVKLLPFTRNFLCAQILISARVKA